MYAMYEGIDAVMLERTSPLRCFGTQRVLDPSMLPQDGRTGRSRPIQALAHLLDSSGIARSSRGSDHPADPIVGAELVVVVELDSGLRQKVLEALENSCVMPGPRGESAP